MDEKKQGTVKETDLYSGEEFSRVDISRVDEISNSVLEASPGIGGISCSSICGSWFSGIGRLWSGIFPGKLARTFTLQ